MNQLIFEKITKLLRKAERATGPEAELCLMKAQQFATEHQIDLATIDTAEGETAQKEEFGTESITPNKKALSRFILWLLQNHFRVKGVVWTYSGRIELIGRKSDVVFATYLFSWLTDHFLAEWKRELRKPAVAGYRRSANAFFYGMHQGLNEKLREAKEKTEETHFKYVVHEKRVDALDPMTVTSEDVKHQYQLAIISEKDALEEEYYRLHPDLRKRRGTSMRVNHNNVAMNAGRAAGARTRLPGIPLGNSTRSQLS